MSWVTEESWLNSQLGQEIHLFSKSSNPFNGYLVLFCQGKGSSGMMQTTHLQLGPRLRMSIVVPLTLHTFLHGTTLINPLKIV